MYSVGYISSVCRLCKLYMPNLGALRHANYWRAHCSEMSICRRPRTARDTILAAARYTYSNWIRWHSFLPSMLQSIFDSLLGPHIWDGLGNVSMLACILEQLFGRSHVFQTITKGLQSGNCMLFASFESSLSFFCFSQDSRFFLIFILPKHCKPSWRLFYSCLLRWLWSWRWPTLSLMIPTIRHIRLKKVNMGKSQHGVLDDVAECSVRSFTEATVVI